MLLELSIRNYVIIEQETMNFTNGLNVITGETGAGKSLVIDAIDAVTGGKLSKDDIRHGAQKAGIEALFIVDNSMELLESLNEYGITLEEDNTLLISREVNTSGKSVARVNGQIVTLSMLRSITENIIDIVGQNEHQLLLNTARHMDLVDNFSQGDIISCKQNIKSLLDEIKSSEAKLFEVCGNTSERERRLDLLKYQIEEIRSAKLKSNEEEELKSRKTLLSNAEKLYKNISFAYLKLFGGDNSVSAVMDIMNECTSSIADAAYIDSSLEGIRAVIESSAFQLEDIKHELRRYRDNIEFNDKEIDSIEERLDIINRLKRKYGASIEEILEYEHKAQQQYDDLVNSEKLAAELEEKINSLKMRYLEVALKLSKERKKSAARLEKLVEKELQDLNMQGAKFAINVESNENTISPKGIDKIEFMISPNPGEPNKPLSKIASGGEMSRIMLAIKNALSNTERLEVLVFDEVDAGIGGVTGTMVGQKIKSIARSVQTVCITHLPQIAAFADNHIYIEKLISNNKTSTSIRCLSEDEKVIEVARMMGGDAGNKSSIQHAMELIKSSRQI